MIDEKKVRELMAEGEGQHVEFKKSIPSKVRELSKAVCAFSQFRKQAQGKTDR